MFRSPRASLSFVLPSVLSSALAALALSACDPAPIVPEETAKPAAATCDGTEYPCGPFGYHSGDVIPNLRFIGRVDANGNGDLTDDPATEIALGDFYKKPGAKVLALLVAAEWCPPCQEEQGELESTWRDYQDQQKPVVFLEVLTQSNDGSPADLDTVTRWTKKKWVDSNTMTSGLKLSFPVAADPTEAVGPYGLSGYPTQLIIDTETMQLLDEPHSGYGAGWLGDTIDGALGQ